MRFRYILQFEQDSWKIKTGDYIATRENCGSILVNLAANYLSVSDTQYTQKEV